MFNLIIEQGNTTTKIAVFENNTQYAFDAYEHFDTECLSPYFDRYPLKNGILSTVTDIDETIISTLRRQLQKFICLDEHTHLPIAIRYGTPHTLGKDRIAAAVGAQSLLPGRNLLVIDAGTAITYDVVEASGTFIGGNISPGMTTRFRALHQFTRKLPLIKEQEQVPVIGTDTHSAILAGVVNGIVYEMDSYITNLQNAYSKLSVYLTGGHSFYFAGRLKNSIFATSNLTSVGLNRILKYNVESH